MSIVRSLLSVCAVIWGAYRLYAPAFSYGFIFDDVPTISENFALRAAQWQQIIFAHSRWVGYLWNWATLKFSDGSAYVFRSHNFILHLIMAALVWWIVRQLLHDKSVWIYAYRTTIANMTTLLFLFHPVQTQTTMFIAQMRLEGLMTALMLVVIAFFIAIIRRPAQAPRNYWLLAGLCISLFLAAGTKEAVIVLPVLLVLIDFFFFAQSDVFVIIRRAPLYLIILAAFYIPYFMLNASLPFRQLMTFDTKLACNRGNLFTGDYHTPITTYTYCLSQLPILLHYLYIYVYPFDLSFDYNFELVSAWDHNAVITSLFVFAILACAALTLWYRNQQNIFAFGLAWFFIVMLPRATCVISTELVTDYKTFATSWVIMMVLATGICVMWRSFLQMFSEQHKIIGKMFFPLIISIIAIKFVDATHERIQVWGSSVNFWRDVVQHTPERPRALNNLGVALMQSGEQEEALEYYHKAIKLDPMYAEPLINLGSYYHQRGDIAKASALYERAATLTHEIHPELFIKQAQIAYKKGSYEIAEKAYQKALSYKRHQPQAWYGLASTYFAQGLYQQALDAARICQHCLGSQIQDPALMLLLGKSLYLMQQHEDALPYLTQALEKMEDHGAWFMVATAYYRLDNLSKASVWYKRLYEKYPNDLDVAYNYAQTLMRREKYAGAHTLFEQCSLAANRYPFAPVHAAQCLFKNGNHEAGRIALAELASRQMPREVALHVRELQSTYC